MLLVDIDHLLETIGTTTVILLTTNQVIGKEIDIIRKVTSNGVKLRTNIRNYPDLMEKNLRYLNTKSRLIKDNMRRSLSEHMRDRRRRTRFR